MNDDFRGGPDRLPPWFLKPQPASETQPTLFPEKLSVVLAKLRVSEDDLARWHERQWISFGPSRKAPLETYDVHQVQFVRDVVRSGLADSQIEGLFNALPRPMTFDPNAVTYSFSLGWVMAKTDPQPDPYEIVQDHVEPWLSYLAESGDKERLAGLRGQIDELLEQMEQTVPP
jgi:hypothetical protein